MRIRHWSGVLVAIACLGVVVSVVMATTNVKIAQAEINKVDESMPKIFISLSDTTLEELNSGDKEEKFFDNDLKLIDGNDVSYFGSVEIKGRGNSTWNVEKKPYQIKFDKKVDFLGMGEARKWVLLANYYDHSSLRTDLAFYIARELDMNYAFDGRFAELYIDDEKIGSLSNGKTFDKEVSNGVHRIVIKSTEKDVVQEVTLDDEHKNVEITLTAKMGLIAARPNIKEVRYY